MISEIIKRGDTDNLSISWDDEDGVVMLFTPNMEDRMEHFHIELSSTERKRLVAFLNELNDL